MDVKETLRALDEDVARLLVAGGSIAGTDDALHARKDALAAFGAKVPVLAKVAEQVGKVTGAKPRAATSELLSLAAMSWQLRAAQSQPARAEGALGAVPPCEKLETPLAAHELEPIYDALSRKGAGRRGRLDDALERNAARDLRLLVPWINALADRDAEVADGAAERGVPSLGVAAVPLVTGQLKLETGNATDARRLRCLARIQGAAAKPLIERALATGSVALRAAAITALAEVDPGAAETVAVRMIAERAPMDVRLAAIDALAKSTSDAGLDALLAALAEGDNLQRRARAALEDNKHPDAGKRLLALLSPEALDVKPYVPAKAKKGLTPAQQKAVQKAEAEAYGAIEKRVAFVRAVIGAFGKRTDDAFEAKMIELWKGHKHGNIAQHAGQALLAIGSPRALETLLGALAPGATVDDERFEQGIKAALRQPPARAFELIAPVLSEKALKVKGHGSRVDATLIELEYTDDKLEFDPRWSDVLLGLATDKEHGQQAMETLAHIGKVNDLGRVIAMLDDKKLVSNAIAVLAAVGDKRAMAPLLALLDRKDVSLHELLPAFRQFDDVAAIGPLRVRYEKLIKPDKKGVPPKTASSWEARRLDETLRFLERDRTLS